MKETTHYTRCTGEGFIDIFHSQVMPRDCCSLCQDTWLNLRQPRWGGEKHRETSEAM